MYQPIMKEKMRELEDKKNEILYSLSEIEKKKETSFITPEIIMEIFDADREVINSSNNPQKIKEVLKKYIKKSSSIQTK